MRVLLHAMLCVALSCSAQARAAGGEPAANPEIDPAPCFGAAASDDDERIVAACGRLIDNAKTGKPDRVKALIARAGAFTRREMFERAIADDDAALLLDPTLADVYNARGELRRRKGDRPGALSDFAAAIRLSSDQAAARCNYKSLAQELEKLGALLAVNNRPSFNCATARRAVEKAICASPDLANLDRAIDVAYARAVNEAAGAGPGAIGTLQRAQDAFLARRNAGFGRRDYDLRQAMKDRLRQLTGTDRY